MFACRTCEFEEEAPSSCVMRHEIASSVGDTAGITQDVGQDPTVGLTRKLSDSVQSVDEAMPSICTMCGQEILCTECGEEPAPGIALETVEEHGEAQSRSGVGKPDSKT